jgi:hypothetical protein
MVHLEGGTHMTAELLIAIAALLASIWAIVANKRTAHEQAQLQQQFLALEKSREQDRLTEASTANLQATLTRHAHSAQLIVTNVGRAEAREIHVRVDGKPVDAHEFFHAAKQPISLLGPRASFEFIMLTYDGMPDTYHVDVDWHNRDGQKSTWASDLTMMR